ncbi:MAG TPA: hypothetical protein VH044_19705, partial [Polyangiaceae bacterium]|nr:hypothetical protein [Polyangiaceae bacterium]
MRSPRSSVGFLFLSALAPLAAGCEVPAQPSVSANTPVAEVSSASPPVDPAADAKLRIAVASGDRPAAEVARDKYRHPLETLEFFGIRDDMTVLELWPGSGWYTAVLAPYLGEKGKL